MNEASPALRVNGLRKHYGDVPVLHGVDLELPDASVLGLVGLNGSGKTTTIECILGLQRFTAGEVSVLGRAPGDLHRLQGDVVAIFDTPSVLPHLSVRQCLEHARRLCPRPVRTSAEVEGPARHRILYPLPHSAIVAGQPEAGLHRPGPAWQSAADFA